MTTKQIGSFDFTPPEGVSVKVTRRKTDTSKTVLLTVNKSTEVSTAPPPGSAGDIALNATRYRKLRDRVDVEELMLADGRMAWVFTPHEASDPDPKLDALVDSLK